MLSRDPYVLVVDNMSARRDQPSTTIFKKVSLSALIQKYSADSDSPAKRPPSARSQPTSVAPIRMKLKLGDLLDAPVRPQVDHLKEYKEFIEPVNDTSIPSTGEYFAYQSQAPRVPEKVASYLRKTFKTGDDLRFVPTQPGKRLPSAVIVCDGNLVQMYDIETSHA